MKPSTRFLVRSLGLLLSLSFPLVAHADLASDFKEPLRLMEAKDFAKASAALDQIAPRYQDQFLLHYMQGIAKMGRLSDKAPVAQTIALLQSARLSLRKAQTLAADQGQKKEALDALKVTEEALREIGAPLEAAPATAPKPAPAPAPADNKDAEIEELKRRLAELEGKATTEAARVETPAADLPAATLTLGPPDLPSTLPKLTPLKPTPKTAKGRVINRSGKPIAGVEVTVRGTTLAGERTSFYPKTNAQGIFSTPVPNGIYTTRAEVKTTYNGQNFIFQLHPLDGNHDLPQDSREGVVEDYVWRLSGMKKEEAEDPAKPWNYYGAEVQGGFSDLGQYGTINDTQAPREKAEFPDGFRVDIAFTPEGTLPDGLPGRAFSYSKTFKPGHTLWPYMNASFGFVDMPLGRYTVRARLVKPDGTARDLFLTARRYQPLQTPALSQQLDFEPDGTSIRPATINVYAWPPEKTE